MEYASSSNSTLLSPSIDFVKPLVSEYLTADQSYVNGVFDTYFVPSAASGVSCPRYTLLWPCALW